MQSIVHREDSISESDGSGGSSLAKLETYDVKAENMPLSLKLARSMTCDGGCTGVGWSNICFGVPGIRGWKSELTKR